MSPNPIDAVARIIADSNSLLVTAHRQPDADAIGSALGLAHAVRHLGGDCAVVFCDPPPASCAFLPGVDSIIAAPAGDSYDAALVLDVDISREERVAAPLDAIRAADVSVIIDHHDTSHGQADLNWIDSSAAATSELIWDLLQHPRLRGALNPHTAVCLYTGLAFDTGGFRFRNTTSRVHRIAADLIDQGAEPDVVARHLFEERSLTAIRVMGAALSGVQTDVGGRLSWSVLSLADLTRLQAADDDAEGVVNIILGLRGAEVGVLFREHEAGLIRVSLRSQPPLDVAAIADQFGGGGHRLAAGCRVEGALQEVVEQVLAAVRGALQRNA